MQLECVINVILSFHVNLGCRLQRDEVLAMGDSHPGEDGCSLALTYVFPFMGHDITLCGMAFSPWSAEFALARFSWVGLQTGGSVGSVCQWKEHRLWRRN